MTVSFATLEFYIIQLLIDLMKQTPRITHAIASNLSFARLRTTVISIYLERYGEDKDYQLLRSLLKRAKQIEDRRNRITHSYWGIGAWGDTNIAIKMRSSEKRGFDAEFEEYPKEILTEFVQNIQALTGEIIDFQKDILRTKREDS